MAQAADAAWYEKAGGVLFGVDRFTVLDYLGQGNITIFMNMYPQLLAYQAPGGLDNITAMAQQGLITPKQLRGWQLIASGINGNNSSQITDGNALLVEVEQTETVQAIFNKDLGLWKTITEYGYDIKSPVPGDTSVFQTVYPGVNFADGWTKYLWTVNYMLPAFQQWRQNNTVIGIKTLLNGGYSN